MPQKITSDTTTAIDTEWQQKLLVATKDISETFILLEPSQDQLSQERQRFIDSGYAYNPDLRPRHLDYDSLATMATQLTELRKEIQTQEPNEYVRDAYDGHIQEHLLNLQMLHAVATGDHQSFIDTNIALYGPPDKETFEAVCSWIRQDASLEQTSNDSQLAALSARVLELIPDTAGDPSILMPSEQVFQKVRDMHFAPGGYFDQLFAPSGTPADPYVDQLQGDEITRQAIMNVRSDYEIKDATDGIWAVLSRSRQVIRPLGYRVDRDYFIGVIAHEIGSHLLEESNGSRSALSLLRLGLGGFEKGNEGRAYLREQIVYPNESVFLRQSSWEYILMLHLAVSLASGTAGRAYMFAELYDLLFALHRFWRQRRYPLDTNNDAEAQEEAWHLSVRIMKGSDGKDGLGGCYMKDTVYLQGNRACWRIAESQPELLLLADLGKFNVADPAHLAILRGLAILP